MNQPQPSHCHPVPGWELSEPLSSRGKCILDCNSELLHRELRKKISKALWAGSGLGNCGCQKAPGSSWGNAVGPNSGHCLGETQGEEASQHVAWQSVRGTLRD